VGAYERDASGMPAWLAVEGFKEIGAVMPGTDAGTGLDAGVVIGEDAAIPPGVDAGPLPDAFVPPGVDAGRVPGADAGPGASSSGCGCRVERRSEPHRALAFAALSVLALALLRRRC
jgi:MYXO-CTERM domain-containing protein